MEARGSQLTFPINRICSKITELYEKPGKYGPFSRGNIINENQVKYGLDTELPNNDYFPSVLGFELKENPKLVLARQELCHLSHTSVF
jgi:hypothetical protein